MYRRFVTLLFFIGGCLLNISGQKISFDRSLWNFGHIMNSSSKQVHTFIFTNTGQSPIVINKVLSTCSCTVTSFSKEPINPGEKGHVVVTFDPKEQMNRVAKQLRVIYNGGKSVHVLQVCGFVDADLRMDEDFPYELASDVFADKYMLSYREMQHNSKPIVKEIRLWNKSLKKVQLSWKLGSGVKCISDVSIPIEIEPHSIAVLRVTVTPPSNFYGTFCDKIIITVNDESKQCIQVYGTVIDDMRGVRLLTAPSLSLSQPAIQLKKDNSWKSMYYKIEIINRGKNILYLRKIECPEGIKVKWGKKDALKSNEKLAVYIIVPSLRNIKSDSFIKIITNDPKKPVFPLVLHYSHEH